MQGNFEEVSTLSILELNWDEISLKFWKVSKHLETKFEVILTDNDAEKRLYKP